MRTRHVATALVLVLLLASVVGLQIVRERTVRVPVVSANLLYVQSPAAMKRLALSYHMLVADLYWIRTVQHYGRTKLSEDPDKKYDVLFPLLDLTTSLDPLFNVAYRFGAIFLAEAYPAGAGRPDQAIALLEKGLKAQPANWGFAQDIGFVYYWWLQDYRKAAEWFQRASQMPGTPVWMAPLAAVTLAKGGDRQTSRFLWDQIARTADDDWMQRTARMRLQQLDAMDAIAQLEALVQTYRERRGIPPTSWNDLIRAGMLRGVPLDPVDQPYELNPLIGTVTLSPSSPLNPLPKPEGT
jgi:tetratricopeptide (TPR) repeat protein